MIPIHDLKKKMFKTQNFWCIALVINVVLVTLWTKMCLPSCSRCLTNQALHCHDCHIRRHLPCACRHFQPSVAWQSDGEDGVILGLLWLGKLSASHTSHSGLSSTLSLQSRPLMPLHGWWFQAFAKLLLWIITNGEILQFSNFFSSGGWGKLASSLIGSTEH